MSDGKSEAYIAGWNWAYDLLYDLGGHLPNEQFEKLAGEVLESVTLADDDFSRGYLELLARSAGRWCHYCERVHDQPNRWNCCPRCLSKEYLDGANLAIEDEAQRTDLVGGFHIEVLVNSKGESRFEVISPGHDGPCKGLTSPAHEELGPLPNAIRALLNATCGHLTRSGKPCRNGPWCRYHRR